MFESKCNSGALTCRLPRSPSKWLLELCSFSNPNQKPKRTLSVAQRARERRQSPCLLLSWVDRMLNQFLTPEGTKLVQKYLGRTWSAFIVTAVIGGSIGKKSVWESQILNACRICHSSTVRSENKEKFRIIFLET